MGNTPSTNQTSTNVETQNSNIEKREHEEEIIFDKILDISKDLLGQYNQEFLREEFCFDLSFVANETLEKMSYPVLLDMANKIKNNKNQTEEQNASMKMILSYVPKEDEKFFVEGFEKQLEDYFWNREMHYDKKLLEQSGILTPELESGDSIFSSKRKNRYIDVAKVNELLRDAQYKKQNRNQNKNQSNEITEEVNINVNENKNKANGIVGGANLQNFQRELNEEMKKVGKPKNVSSMKRNVKIIANGKNNNSNFNQIRKNLQGNLLSSNQNKNNQVNVANILNAMNKQINVISAKNNKNNKNVSKEVVRENIQNVISKNISPPPNTKKNNIKINQTQNQNKIIPSIPNKKTSLVQYIVKKDYEKPSKICLEGMEKCSLTKKQLCKMIAENMIIRCNIIAGILNVLPNRKSKHGYYGGYLYSKFLNLGKCQVCVPYNYKELMDLPPVQMIKHIVQYSDFLDPKSCKENGGYYLKLSKNEIKALYDNVPTNGQIEIGKQLNYNAFYVECAKKLKDNYFDNLKVLLEILEQLKSQPVINNVTLNELGLKAKQIIDSMYHLCQYYYIYAIVSLLHANLTPTKVTDVSLQTSMSKALQKNSSS